MWHWKTLDLIALLYAMIDIFHRIVQKGLYLDFLASDECNEEFDRVANDAAFARAGP